MNRDRAAGLTIVLGVLALGFSACSERPEAPSEPTDDGEVAEIVIRDFAFAAPTITIDRGTAVRWRSTTATFHTVTPDGHQAFVERQVNTSGETFAVRFDEPGRYRYYCLPHRTLGMTGEVIVR